MVSCLPATLLPLPSFLRTGVNNYPLILFRTVLIYFFLIADFMRPVVILGPVADLVRMLLVDEMPDRFASPSKKCLFTLNYE